MQLLDPNPDNKNVTLLAKSTMDIDEYIWDLSNRKGLTDGMKSLNKNITLHSSCHSRAQNIGPKSAQILRLIPNTKTINIEFVKPFRSYNEPILFFYTFKFFNKVLS